MTKLCNFLNVFLIIKLLNSPDFAHGSSRTFSPKSGASSQQQYLLQPEPSSRLYEVSIPSMIHQASIKKLINRRPALRVTGFEPAVAKGDIFLVISSDGSTVVAELTLYKLSRNKNTALTDIRRIAADFERADLVGLMVVSKKQMKHYKNTPRGNLVSKHNPLISFGMASQSYILGSTNFLTGASIDPLISTQGALAEFFFPSIKNHKWTNWLGIAYTSHTINAALINLRQTSEKTSQKATIEGQEIHFDLIARPSIGNSVLSRFAIIVGLLRKRKESIKFEQSFDATLPASNLSLKVEGPQIGFQFELTPHPNTTIGFECWPGISQAAIAKDSSQPGLDFTGNWLRSDIGAWMALSYPFQFYKKKWTINGQFGLTRRQDKINGQEIAANLESRTLTDYRTYGLIFLSFIKT